MTHGDSIERVGDKLEVAGRSSNNIVTAIYNQVLRIYGVQFHPEVDLTISGRQMLKNFVLDICGITPNFTMASRKEICLKYIKEKVGNNTVLVISIKIIKMHYLIHIFKKFFCYNYYSCWSVVELIQQCAQLF